jgi:hypothetical protein
MNEADLAQRDFIHESDPLTHKARREINDQIAKYGSLERWPTLSLLPKEFSICECGCDRTSHHLAGMQRLGCKKTGCCDMFVAPIYTPEKRGR